MLDLPDEQYEDPDGPLALSDSQMKIFNSWEQPNHVLNAQPVMEASGVMTYVRITWMIARLLHRYCQFTR